MIENCSCGSRGRNLFRDAWGWETCIYTLAAPRLPLSRLLGPLRTCVFHFITQVSPFCWSFPVPPPGYRFPHFSIQTLTRIHSYYAPCDSKVGRDTRRIIIRRKWSVPKLHTDLWILHSPASHAGLLTRESSRMSSGANALDTIKISERNYGKISEFSRFDDRSIKLLLVAFTRSIELDSRGSWPARVGNLISSDSPDCRLDQVALDERSLPRVITSARELTNTHRAWLSSPRISREKERTWDRDARSRRSEGKLLDAARCKWRIHHKGLSSSKDGKAVEGGREERAWNNERSRKYNAVTFRTTILLSVAKIKS